MITSVQNEKVKQWNKLHKRKGRTKSGTFFIEGFHLVEEAHKSEWEIVEIIVQKDTHYPDWFDDYMVTVVGEKVLQYIARTETPQGVSAIIKMKEPKAIMGNSILLIDSIQDPGNLGTVIRTADAAGFDAVMLGDNTVDMYNDKVIRSTQGSLFHLSISQVNIKEKIPQLKTEGFSVWASALSNARQFNKLEVPEKTALIIGNEGAGIQSEIVDLADIVVKIPIYGEAESLNVSVAAGILMYYIKM
ncbi:TrmH family RNA methyltransferase [Virgibacillus salinus]|uniref:RNA methyltransferase, TrmH family n=1 Tax=Virgibacillus salinus TaxID=553311 RepID=A0A1H1AYT1_9BACI|nr:RNA methyltransferase [Virgibacillus salinus]SDQ44855.1 RNA methyltransferase, TrmH family [Virgibacillus salinus]